MNEILFLLHLVFLLVFLLWAFSKGKTLLMAYMAGCAVFANLFVLKQITLFSMEVTAADAYAVGSIFAFNLLREFYGKQEAKSALHAAFFLLLALGGLSFIHLCYLPSSFDQTNAAYAVILSSTPRIAFSSLVVFGIVQMWDLWFYGKMQRFYQGRFFVARMAFCSALSQLMDTTLFTFFALYGEIAYPWHVVFFSFCIKLIAIGFFSPFCHFCKRLEVQL